MSRVEVRMYFLLRVRLFFWLLFFSVSIRGFWYAGDEVDSVVY